MAKTPSGPWTLPPAAQAATDYWIDAWQRSVLTWDLLRQRGNQYLEHERNGNPPVLVFDYETVLDGRELARPANYALVRIKPPAGCPKPDAAKRPSWSSTRAPGTARASAASRWTARSASRCSWATPATS